MTFQPIIPRLESMSEVRDCGCDTPCWAWTGATRGTGARGAYAQVSFRGRHVSAHRLCYELLVGPIEAGKQLDHLCRNRLCINPEHLDPTTGLENLLRSSITTAAINSAKTSCPQGHPYDNANTYIDKRGKRYCRACLNARRGRYR